MNRPDRILSALGLAKRAGKIVTGTLKVQEAVRSGKALMVLMAADISDGSRKKIKNTCDYYNTELAEYSTMEMLSASLGEKKLITSIAITDTNFKILIKKQFSAQSEGTEND